MTTTATSSGNQAGGQKQQQQQQPENLHVITENGEQCFRWQANQLTYIAQERHEIPPILASKFGHLATRLDLSYNSLTSFRNINSFTQLNELILDNNLLEDDQLEFEVNYRLKTLSLNKNKLTNLYKVVNRIKVCLPNLEYLSLIGNPLCLGSVLAPDGERLQLSSQTPIDELVLDSAGSSNSLDRQPRVGQMGCEIDQQKYRHFVIYHLPNLRFLDSRPITPGERDEALQRCFWMSQATLNQLNDPCAMRSSSTTCTTMRSSLSSSSTSSTRGQHRRHSEESSSSSCEADVGGPEVGGAFRLSIMTGGRARGDELRSQRHVDEQCDERPRGVFSRLAYKYTGRNSEGNRFIRNQDL